MSRKVKVEKDAKKEIRVYSDDLSYRNIEFENLCLLTQKKLKSYLYDYLSADGEVVNEDGYLYRKGTFPVLLVAHMDTVHTETPKEIIYANGTISSPQGIGGDDRCGIYMIQQIIKEYNCSVLFCEDEETGCIGSKKFAKSKLAKELEGTFLYIIELDRKGKKDAVFYDCDNPDFTEFITKEYFKEESGSFTDICEISEVLNAASVNFSCGYYEAHRKTEYVVLSEMETVIEEVLKLFDRTTMSDKFEYIERETIYSKYGGYYSTYDKYYGGYGYEMLYFIGYENKNKEIVWEEVEATSMQEAVGVFLMEHPTLRYIDIVDIIDEFSYDEETLDSYK